MNYKSNIKTNEETIKFLKTTLVLVCSVGDW